MTGLPGTASDSLPPIRREAWIDVAKGIAIVLVVLFHSTMYLALAGVVGPLTVLNPLLDTFRMPLFFFMSGILGARAVTLSFPALFRRRLLLLLYLYVVWVVLQQLYIAVMPPVSPLGRLGGLEGIVELFVIPNANLWFIYALPLFFTAAWLSRTWPAVVPLILSAALAVAFGSGLLHTGTAWDKMGKYLFFFLLALRAGAWVRTLAQRARWWQVGVVVVVYAACVAAAVKFELLHAPGVLLVLSAFAVVVGIELAVVLSRMAWFDWLAALGSRTLQIYLVHTFPMIAFAGLVVALGWVSPVWLAAILPLLLCAAAILIALLVHRLLRAVPGVFTFPIAGWVTSSTVPPAAREASPAATPQR